MPKILALDQSSHITGYAIFEDAKLIKYGIIELKQSDLGQRLYKLRQSIEKLILEENISEIIIEDIQLQEDVANNVQTFKTLAEVMGVIYEYCIEISLPISFVMASSWKSKLNIKGRDRAAQKREASNYVTNTYDLNVTQDIADAICIGTYYFLNKKSKKLSWSK